MIGFDLLSDLRPVDVVFAGLVWLGVCAVFVAILSLRNSDDD